MKSHDFRGVLRAQPFCPFAFTTVDGETFTVDHAEDAWHSPDGEIVAVSAPGGIVLVGVESITRVVLTLYPPGVTGQSERLMELKRADPYVPFAIHLADGRRLLVKSADHIMIPNSGSTVIVADPDGLVLLDSDQITDIKLIIEPPGRAARVERLRTLKRADPFVPFVMHLADGRRLLVADADRMMVPPHGGTVCLVGEGGTFHMLHADQITDVEAGPGAPPS